MTAPMAGRPRSTRIVLIVLAGLTLLAAILTPEAVTIAKGERSTFVAGPGGTRILFDLAARLGWNVERRMTALDSVAQPRATHVVIAPGAYLGAGEVHRLLENVRRGGGLVFTMDGGDQIADSIGVGLGRSARTLTGIEDADCPQPQTIRDRPVIVLPPDLEQIVWRRPPPSVPDTLMEAIGRVRVPVVIGFTLGAGRVAIVSSSDLLSNDVLRICDWNADIAAARVLEYMRPPGVARPTMIFDEFHHGYGEHGGTFVAIGSYFSRTASGRFLAQLLLAGLLVVLAQAPRPVIPREAERIVRRSPLEHADALGHAYADVRATRTAVAQLLSGLRRRVGRIAGVGDSATDEAFLAGAVARAPELARQVAIVQHALREPIDITRMPAVGDALQKIEHHLLAQIKTLS
jgi:hypothetical protein